MAFSSLNGGRTSGGAGQIYVIEWRGKGIVEEDITAIVEVLVVLPQNSAKSKRELGILRSPSTISYGLQ